MAELPLQSTRPTTPAPPKVKGPLPSSSREWDRRSVAVGDKIRIRGLATNANVGVDAWGRRKVQPLLISVTLALSQPFLSAAAKDQIDPSTVHYGLLSKTILAAVEKKAQEAMDLATLAFVVTDAVSQTVPDMATVLRTLEVQISLPKASLLGAAAGYQFAKIWSEGVVGVSEVLFLKDIRIATLIGVNAHEKKMRQHVLVNVWIDPVTRTEATDCYTELEQLICKTIEEAAFETLESLASQVVAIIVKRFVFILSPGSDVRLRVEKPSAVPFADAPGVEIVRSSRDGDEFAMKMWEECRWKRPARVPFPLQGRLSDFLLQEI
ncbi:MAG: hypothetical protein M1829_001063 [Trizodia sp. TS-e1964]|nr:MAG: hypothetical protein M1829_001063 [Trizodia sp. TS-e1964]